MATAAFRGAIPRFWLVIWAFIGLAAAWFVYESIIYVASRDPQPGATFLNRQLWYLAHMAIATPILIIAPIQFIAQIRKSRPEVHRWLGRAFLTASILAGVLAIWLGATLLAMVLIGGVTSHTGRPDLRSSFRLAGRDGGRDQLRQTGL